MARMSAEARSAAAHKSGGKPPAPPDGFGEAESKIWRAITRQKPLGWFDAGSLPLLGQYCRTLVLAEKTAAGLMTMAVDDPLAIEVGKHLVRLNGSVTTMATKLRLSVQGAVSSRSGMIVEINDDAAIPGDNLLGGAAVWGENQAVN